MHPLINRLLKEHLDLARLVALLDRQPTLQADASATGIGVLVDALAASASLREDDWRAIETSARRDLPDPLFHSDVQARFVDLHRAIAAKSGCGCD
jgi:hypothetical protein